MTFHLSLSVSASVTHRQRRVITSSAHFKHTHICQYSYCLFIILYIRGVTETNHAICEQARRLSRRAFQLFPLELSLACGILFTDREIRDGQGKGKRLERCAGHCGGSVGIVTRLRAGSRSCRGSILDSPKRPYDLRGPTSPMSNAYRGFLPREEA